VLEVGCGTGELIAQVKGIRKTGVDFSEAMIQKAREQYPDIGFHCMDAQQLELFETFDVIILSNLVGWLNDVQVCFQQIRKHCHPRTRIIITYYNFLWEPVIKFSEFIGIKKKSPEQNWLSQKDILNLLYLTDMEAYRRQRNMLLPVNIPLVSWFFNKYLAPLPLLNSLCLNQHIFARPAAMAQEKKFTVSVVKIVWISLIDLVTGNVGFNQLSGPVGVTQAIGQAARVDFTNLLFLVVFITINLGVVNLLPLPALDGGRLIFLIVEGVRRKPVDPRYEGYVHFAGFVLLILLMIAVTFQDIVKLIQ
jgi:SAM-dependent methyltransferase